MCEIYPTLSFHTGGERHAADEEESLFPRLRVEPTAGILEDIDRLESDHHHAADLQEPVDWLYTAWISTGMLESNEQQQLLSQTQRLKRLYAEHIQIEETIVFPHAAQVLNSQVLAAMGSEFSARRK